VGGRLGCRPTWGRPRRGPTGPAVCRGGTLFRVRVPRDPIESCLGLVTAAHRRPPRAQGASPLVHCTGIGAEALGRWLRVGPARSSVLLNSNGIDRAEGGARAAAPAIETLQCAPNAHPVGAWGPTASTAEGVRVVALAIEAESDAQKTLEPGTQRRRRRRRRSSRRIPPSSVTSRSSG